MQGRVCTSEEALGNCLPTSPCVYSNPTVHAEEEQEEEEEGYLCPSSWATVKARGSPVSSLMLQLRWGWHIPATWDSPRVSQGLFMAAQISFLGRGDEDTQTDRQTQSREGVGRQQDPAHGQRPNRSENGDIQHPSTGETFLTFPFPFPLPVSSAHY